MGVVSAKKKNNQSFLKLITKDYTRILSFSNVVFFEMATVARSSFPESRVEVIGRGISSYQ